MKSKAILHGLLLLGCIMFFSSCSLFDGANNKKIIDYLKSVGPDFEKSKESLKLFDDQFGSDLDGITKELDLVTKSKSDFQSRMENTKGQAVPDNPKELTDFHYSLIEYYTDAIKLMNDLELILRYSHQLLKSFEPIEKASNVSPGKAPSVEEIKTMMKTLKSSIDESLKTMEKCTPPQYMTDSHENFVAILKIYGSATDDFIYALQLTDPLRINANTYRYELLSNKLKYISDEMDKDIEKELASMNEAGKRLQKSQDELYRQLLLWQGEYKISN